MKSISLPSFYLASSLIVATLLFNSLTGSNFSAKSIAIAIVETKIDPSLPENNMSELHKAVFFSNIDQVEKIINLISTDKNEKKAILSAKNSAGNSPLHLALGRLFIYRSFLQENLLNSGLINHATEKLLKIVKILLTAGADVNLQNQDKWTPLHLAAMIGDWTIVKLFFKQGAIPFVQESIEKTPVCISALCGHFDATKGLLKKTPLSKKELGFLLLDAAIGNNPTLVSFLIEKGCDFSIALIEASKLPLYTPLNLLFSKIGFRTDICSSEGASLLAIAIEHNSSDVFTYLLSRKYPLTIPDHKKRTPLHIAAIKKNIDFARLLLTNGANKKVQDSEGKLPENYDARIKNLKFT
ncbi:MAG: hypothetical protein UW09_C0002G0111 [candidate division TM6 bacterium GW2011_GWF2_43_87]|nr:MAG: hypothetical protein UW09_C0002G0111 [candidate division TM6 bacterium GW2011_GWF2_43_87]